MVPAAFGEPGIRSGGKGRQAYTKQKYLSTKTEEDTSSLREDRKVRKSGQTIKGSISDQGKKLGGEEKGRDSGRTRRGSEYLWLESD